MTHPCESITDHGNQGPEVILTCVERREDHDKNKKSTYKVQNSASLVLVFCQVELIKLLVRFDSFHVHFSIARDKKFLKGTLTTACYCWLPAL